MVTDNGEFISNKLRNLKLRHFEEKLHQAEQELAEWGNPSPLIGIRKLECTYHADKYLTVKDRKGNAVNCSRIQTGIPCQILGMIHIIHTSTSFAIAKRWQNGSRLSGSPET